MSTMENDYSKIYIQFRERFVRNLVLIFSEQFEELIMLLKSY